MPRDEKLSDRSIDAQSQPSKDVAPPWRNPGVIHLPGGSVTEEDAAHAAYRAEYSFKRFGFDVLCCLGILFGWGVLGELLHIPYPYAGLLAFSNCYYFWYRRHR